MTGAAVPRPPRSRGPRGGGADTRGDIVRAAADAFAAKGYAGASMREIARAADVDPALVRHYFADKAELFVAVMRPLEADDARIAALAATPRERMGVALLQLFLSLWEDPEAGPRLRAIAHSVVSIEEVGSAMAGAMMRDIAMRIVREDRAPLRAAACGSQLMGLALGRYLFRLPPLAQADGDTLSALYGPTLQRFIDGDLPAPPAGSEAGPPSHG